MNETQRAAAIRLSSLTPGGDGTTLVLDLGFGSLLDFMGNPSPFQSNQAPGAMSLIEYPDLTPPKLLTATLNYGTGLLTIEADETIDGTTLTASTCVNGSAFVVMSLNTSLGFIPTRLTGSSVSTDERKDGIMLTIQLPEATRLIIQQQQDLLLGSQLTLAASVGGVFDLMRNPNLENLTLGLPTIPDTQPPVVLLVDLNYGTGMLTITTDESLFIGVTSSEGLFQFRLRLSNQIVNVTDGFDQLNNTNDEVIELDNAVFIGKVGGFVSSVQFVIYLGELDRTKALRMSGTNGGDNTPLFMSIEAEAFQDMVGNNNTAQVLVVQESPDTVLPILISAALNYSTGRLRIVSNEILDLTSLRFGSLGPENFFNTSNLLITDIQGDTDSTTAKLDGAVASFVHEDGFSVDIIVTEAHRAAAVVTSEAVDGEGMFSCWLFGF